MPPLKSILINTLLISLPFVWFTPISALHKFYLSITTIETSNNGQNIECTLKLFRDDLEQALEKASGAPLILEVGEPNSMIDSLFSIYLDSHFSISIIDKKLQGKYIGAEIEEDMVWLYIEYEKPAEGTYFVKNSCLMEIFDEQTNMVNVVKNGQTKSAMFTLNQHEASFNL